VKNTVFRTTAYATCASILAAPLAFAQDDTGSGAAGALLEEITVTARKREEMAQSVPISISAFSGAQLEALKVRDLQDLSIAMPNVSLDDIATFRSTANFSIRGLGINSSIPSIDPTVGVFVDGVYMGQNLGVVIDMYDIASIEVLRGPQGTLFGRNVTGGAILVNTKRPGDEFEVGVRAALDGNPSGDGGMTQYLMGSIGGPISDTFGARLSVYYSDDEGYWVNQFDGSDHGAAETKIIRPVLTWTPNDDLDFTLRWEHLESEGDGPASQSHTNGRGIPGQPVNFDRESFDFAIDEPGFYQFDNDFVTFEANWDIGFGDGTITNIFGWKDYTATSLSDIDAQPIWMFHAPAWSNQEQLSNELRYSGQFGNAVITTGLFWFTQEINYHERRNLLGVATGGVAPALTQDGGGDYEVDSVAWFGEADFALTDRWNLILGLRYTDESKSADIASLVRNVDSPCNVVIGGPFCAFDFQDEEDWQAWSGKLGFTYNMDAGLVYGNWSRSQRAGGYNLRNTAIDTVNLGPGPFDEETVDNFEIGLKTDFTNGARFNAAVFFTQVADQQREVNLSDPISGVVQVIKNTADTDIFGIEFDTIVPLGDSTVLTASLGYIDAEYQAIFFDLTGDGVIDENDLALKPPRAPELTYSIGITQDFEFGNGSGLSLRANYAYVDDAFYTDDNLGRLNSRSNLTAGIDWFSPTSTWIVSLYGRNLLDDVGHGGDTQLPAILGPIPLGGTFSPLTTGRIAGIEVTFQL
jgi:iron complex outermembrane receptor protein